MLQCVSLCMSASRSGLVNIQLSTDEDKELWRDLEAYIADQRGLAVDDLSRAEVVAAAARRVLPGPDCNHLEDYHLEVNGETVCMRCRGDGDQAAERAVEADVMDVQRAGGPGA